MSNTWKLVIAFLVIYTLVYLFLHRVVKINFTRHDVANGYDSTYAVIITVVIMYFILKSLAA